MSKRGRDADGLRLKGDSTDELQIQAMVGAMADLKLIHSASAMPTPVL